jgi:hypothetical protein
MDDGIDAGESGRPICATVNIAYGNEPVPAMSARCPKRNFALAKGLHETPPHKARGAGYKKHVSLQLKALFCEANNVIAILPA